MQTIELKSRAGADGVLRFEIPAGGANTDYDVLIVLQPSNRDGTQAASENRAWLPAFFEQTAGAWEGEQLVREPQGDFEMRDEIS